MKIKIKPQVKLNESAIQNDLEKFARTCAETIVNEAQRVITRFAREQMSGYYGEYDPRVYDRTNQMLNSSYKPFIKKGGNHYEGGVIISPENTYHVPGSDNLTEDQIYNMVWVEGIHGYEKVGYPVGHWAPIQGEPDRLNKLKKKVYGSEIKQKIIARGMARAKEQSYSILKFR